MMSSMHMDHAVVAVLRVLLVAYKVMLVVGVAIEDQK